MVHGTEKALFFQSFAVPAGGPLSCPSVPCATGTQPARLNRHVEAVAQTRAEMTRAIRSAQQNCDIIAKTLLMNAPSAAQIVQNQCFDPEELGRKPRDR